MKTNIYIILFISLMGMVFYSCDKEESVYNQHQDNEVFDEFKHHMTNVTDNNEIINKLERTRVFDVLLSNFKECSSDYEVYILSFEDNDTHSFIISHESVSKSDNEIITVIPIIDFDDFILAEPSILSYYQQDLVTIQTAYSLDGEEILTISFDENGNAEILDDDNKRPGHDQFYREWRDCMIERYEDLMSTWVGQLQIAVTPIATYAWNAAICVEVAIASFD